MMSDDLEWTQALGAAVLDQLGDVQDSVQQFRAEVQAAEAQLQKARDAQQAGQALQPGDLIGKQGGGTRPSLQRTERLRQLDERVKAAEENLERVRRGQ